MEKNTNLAHRIFLIATLVLLGVGFVLARLWPGVIIILAMIPLRWITRRFENRLFSWMTLVIFTGLSVFGLLSAATPYLMIAGVSTALAFFEVEDRISGIPRNSMSSNMSSFEKHHLRTICFATAAGLIIAEAGLLLRYSLPFGVIFLVVIFVLFGLFQLFTQFKRT